MSASPEFYKPAAFTSPCGSPLPAAGFAGFGGAADDYHSCRTPTGSGITFLKEPTSCPPAPRKPVCKKRLFHQQQEVPLISVRLDELERIFRPHPPEADKRRRSLQNTTLDTNKEPILVTSWSSVHQLA